MSTCFLAPAPVMNTFFIPGSNTPGSGVQVFFYTAGSVSTKTTVYQDSAGATPWSNPLVLDSGGNIPSGSKEIWIPSGVSVKVVYAPSTDTDPPVSPYLSLDNLSGINDVSTTITASEWTAGPTPSYVSATSFTVVGDQTATYTKGRRIKATVTAGTVYNTVTGVSFGGGTTTVTVSGGSLDSGLTAISYGLFDPTNPSISFYETSRQATASIASAATTNIWGTDGDSVHVTGTTQIASFSTAPYAGATKRVIFDSQAALTYNSSTMVVPSTSGAWTVAGDALTVYADTVSKMLVSGFQPSFFVTSYTYQMSTASGAVSIAAPFKPRSIDVIATGGGQIGAASWGFADDNGNAHCMYDDFANSSTNAYSASPSVFLLQTSVGNFVSATVSSFGNGLINLNVTKTGAPNGSATLKIKATR